MFAQEVLHEEDGDLMKFRFGREQQDLPFTGRSRPFERIHGHGHPVNDQRTGKMFLAGMHFPGQPQRSYPVEQGKDHMDHTPLEPRPINELIEYLFETELVEVEGRFRQLVDIDAEIIRTRLQFQRQPADFLLRKAGDPGDLISMFVQMGDLENIFEIVTIIEAVLAFLPFRTEEMMALLPDTQRMGLDACKIFYVPDRENVHIPVTKRKL